MLWIRQLYPMSTVVFVFNKFDRGEFFFIHFCYELNYSNLGFMLTAVDFAIA